LSSGGSSYDYRVKWSHSMLNVWSYLTWNTDGRIKRMNLDWKIRNVESLVVEIFYIDRQRLSLNLSRSENDNLSLRIKSKGIRSNELIFSVHVMHLINVKKLRPYILIVNCSTSISRVILKSAISYLIGTFHIRAFKIHHSSKIAFVVFKRWVNHRNVRW